MLTMHCTAKENAQRLCGEGGVKLSNANQPTVSIGTVHHVYSTCLNARTMFSHLNIFFFKMCVHDAWACEFVTHTYVNLHSCSVCMYEHVCVFEITFVFHAFKMMHEIPTTLFFILLLFNYVCYQLCVQHYRG